MAQVQREEAQRLEKDIAYLQAEKRELISATAAEAAELHRLKVEVMAAGEAIASHRTFSLQGLSPVPRHVSCPLSIGNLTDKGHSDKEPE